MDICQLPPEEAAVRRYVEELWLPYHRVLETVVDHHRLADDADIVDEEVAFRRSRLEDPAFETWVAVDGTGSRGVPKTTASPGRRATWPVSSRPNATWRRRCSTGPT